MTSSTPPPGGSIGTTIAACTPASGWSHQPNTSRSTTLFSTESRNPDGSVRNLGQLGALDLYRTTPGPLSPEATAAAQALADVAGACLINASAREELRLALARTQEALHDGLTGLPNRQLLMYRLEHAFARSRRSGLSSAVLFIDVDRLKAVNDSYVHAVGDLLLVAVADRLLTLVRPGDTLPRPPAVPAPPAHR